MLQKKNYICYKRLSNGIQMQKGALKNQKPRVPYLIAQEDHRKNDLHPNFTKEIFYRSLNLIHKKRQSLCSFPKQNKFWIQKLRLLKAHVWNLLPENIR